MNDLWYRQLYNYTYNLAGGGTLGYNPGGCTNWGHAMEVAFRTQWTVFDALSSVWDPRRPDIVIIFTDGAPTVHNGVCNQHCNFNRVRESFPNVLLGSCNGYDVGVACYYADLLKRSGVKLFLVGVGDVSQNLPNVKLVTSNRVWDLAPNTFASSDFMTSQDYTQLGVMFLNVVKGLCTCYQNAPLCDGVQTCLARSFSARTRVTTLSTSSSTFAPNSVQLLMLHYNYVPTPNTRVAYEFFALSDQLSSGTPTIIRTDVQDPCRVERNVKCGNQCFTVSERQDIPRFFLESRDLLGATNPSWRAPQACIGEDVFFLFFFFF